MKELDIDEQNLMDDAGSIVRASEVLMPLLLGERDQALQRLTFKFQDGESDHQTEVATIVAVNNILKKVEAYKETYQRLKEKQHGN